MSLSTSVNFSLLFSLLISPAHQAGMFIATKQCFFSNGQISDQDTPCHPNASSTESFCCNSTQRCLAGGVCQTTDLVKYPGPEFSRPSCTDQTWKSEACARYCLDATSPTSLSIKSCGLFKFCCAANATDTDCCSSGSPLFVLTDNFEATPQNATGIPTPFRYVVRGSSSPMAAPMATASSHPNTRPRYLSLPIKLAIGFSAALVIALLFCTLLYLLERRSRKQRSAATATGEYHSRSSSDASHTSIFDPKSSRFPPTDAGIGKKHVKKASISRPVMILEMQAPSAISSPRTPPPLPMNMPGGNDAQGKAAPDLQAPAILPPPTLSPPARSVLYTPPTTPATPVLRSANGSIPHVSRPDLGGLRSVHALVVPTRDLRPAADAVREGPSSDHPPLTSSWLRPNWPNLRISNIFKLSTKTEVQESGWARTRPADTDTEVGLEGQKRIKVGAVRKVHEVLGRGTEGDAELETGGRVTGQPRRLRTFAQSPRQHF